MNKFSRLCATTAMAIAAFGATSLAHASTISGGFSLTSFGGSYVAGNGTSVSPYTDTGTASTATGLDFGLAGGGSGNGFGTNGSALVGNATGSFTGLNLTTASVADILLGTTANPYLVNPFISFGSNSAITVSFSNATVTRSMTGTSVTVAGVAMFSDGIAADASTGTFSLSANSQTGDSTGVNLTFTSNVAAPVAVTPEPNSLVLLGTGLIGAATTMLRRRKNIA